MHARGSQLSLRIENLPLENLPAAPAIAGPSRLSTAASTASTEDTCVELVAHTAAPISHVALPKSNVLSIVVGSPTDAARRKYRRDIF